MNTEQPIIQSPLNKTRADKWIFLFNMPQPLMRLNKTTLNISKDAIIILEKNKNINNGDLALFSINDIFYIRKYFKNDKTVVLSHINSQYEPIIVTDSSDLKIYGKIIIP